MKVLILGSGGREHAMARVIARSLHVTQVYCAPGNAGTREVATNVSLDLADHDAVVAFAKREHIDLTVVGPEAPLVAGIVDRFRAEQLRVFGPTAAGAKIEGSKAWAKHFMERHGVPTASFTVTSDPNEARDRIWALTKSSGVVLKADGLAGGKGVVVADRVDEALEAVERILVQKEFGGAGDQLVIEERLRGIEVSVIAALDGTKWWTFPAAQDHKPLLDGDRGPNTGGMGAYAPVPMVDLKTMREIETRIFRPVVEGLKKDGIDYRGFLFAGLMLTRQGPKVLEFNCRFGDPEAQVLLPGLQTDLVELIQACLDGRLESLAPQVDGLARLCVVAASPGYPGPVHRGLPVEGLDETVRVPGVEVYHAGTAASSDGTVVTSGGRVLNVVGSAPTLGAAAEAAYQALDAIRIGGERPVHRKDIGFRALLSGGMRG